MATNGTQPLIFLNKIKIEDGLEEDEQIICKSSMEVGHEIPEIDQCGTPQTDISSVNWNNAATSIFALNVKSESQISDYVKMSPSVDLVAKVNGETEDKISVTRELVGYLHGNLTLKKEASLQIVKTENDGTNNEGKMYHDDSSGNCFKSRDSSDIISDESLSNIYYDSNRIKLVYVSVKLDDLFSTNDRRLGKAHSNDRSCSCMYCRGGYKHVCDLPPKNYCGKKGFRSAKSEGKVKEKGKRSFECEKCHKYFRDRYALKVHSKVHSSKKLFSCGLCSATFKSRYHMGLHMLTHNDEVPFCCNFCSAAYTENKALQVHVRSVHHSEKPFSCSLCFATFGRRDHLTNHMKRLHTKKRPFSCNLCSATFKERCTFQRHMKFHSSERPFSCKLCPSTFKYKDALKNHQMIHSDERPFSCSDCPATFKWKANVKVHLMTVHMNRIPLYGKRFSCCLCSTTFAHKSSLRIHKRVHTGEKPFQCKICSAEFRSSSRLNSHLLVHADKRPFSCDLCPATFKRKCALSNHKNTKKHKFVKK